MAKTKRQTIGSVYKGKDGRPDYIKVSRDVSLKKGTYLNLESKAAQLASIESALDEGRVSEETANKVRERLESIPDYVRFEIVQVEKVEPGSGS